MTSDRRPCECNIWKILSFSSLLLSCLIMIIIFYLQPTPKYLLIVPDEYMNGGWSEWSEWSLCNATCHQNKSINWGFMIRYRKCNSPYPARLGKQCNGSSSETTDCFVSSCLRLKANSYSWSSWTSCSATCKTKYSIPHRSRSRKCSIRYDASGTAKKDVYCTENGVEKMNELCSHLPYCPVKSRDNWVSKTACRPLSKDAECSLGSQIMKRWCYRQKPTSIYAMHRVECHDGTLSERLVDCWYLVGCPTDLQPPRNVKLFAQGNGMFNLTWQCVPYGVEPEFFQIYMTLADKIESYKLLIDLFKIPTANKGKRKKMIDYWKPLNLSNFFPVSENQKKFYSLSVRMSSVDNAGKESDVTFMQKSLAAAVDGRWGNWGYWGDCSARCRLEQGTRKRYRQCNNPDPTSDGKACVGKKEESSSCTVMNQC